MLQRFHSQVFIRPNTLIRLLGTSPVTHKISSKNDIPISGTQKKLSFIHDYSVLPNSVQYRLPTGDNSSEQSKAHGNLVKLIFEKGGIQGMDLEENARLFEKYPITNSRRLAKRSKKPKSVKMLTSDFIENSLYNPYYGYFSKEAVIFQPNEGFDFKQLKGQDEFMSKWLAAYDKYDKETLPILKHSKKNDFHLDKPSLQLWHTPTELFQPYYGQALARYMLVNYKLNQYPYNDLTIYEVGGGNGTLMLNIMDYIKETQPDVYERTNYKIIEISNKLFNKQNSRLAEHMDKVEVINKSILEWNTTVSEPCFVVALEVFDNFAHDVVRYDIDTNQPFQGYVVIDENNDFKEFYSPNLDEWTMHFLHLREQGAFPIAASKGHPLNQFKISKKFKSSFNPLRNNFSDSEFVPTRLIKFFEILKAYFPNHQLVSSDFNQLDNTVDGYCGPVVQTMHKDKMITIDSYMCNEGYFDIMFPTDFEVISDLYKQIVGKISSTCTHAEFLKVWADVDSTTTKTGENPMLEMYANASFIYS